MHGLLQVSQLQALYRTILLYRPFVWSSSMLLKKGYVAGDHEDTEKYVDGGRYKRIKYVFLFLT